MLCCEGKTEIIILYEYTSSYEKDEKEEGLCTLVYTCKTHPWKLGNATIEGSRVVETRVEDNL